VKRPPTTILPSGLDRHRVHRRPGPRIEGGVEPSVREQPAQVAPVLAAHGIEFAAHQHAAVLLHHQTEHPACHPRIEEAVQGAIDVKTAQVVARLAAEGAESPADQDPAVRLNREGQHRVVGSGVEVLIQFSVALEPGNPIAQPSGGHDELAPQQDLPPWLRRDGKDREQGSRIVGALEHLRVHRESCCRTGDAPQGVADDDRVVALIDLRHPSQRQGGAIDAGDIAPGFQSHSILHPHVTERLATHRHDGEGRVRLEVVRTRGRLGHDADGAMITLREPAGTEGIPGDLDHGRAQ
jgi:hypothetical protein